MGEFRATNSPLNVNFLCFDFAQIRCEFKVFWRCFVFSGLGWKMDWIHREFNFGANLQHDRARLSNATNAPAMIVALANDVSWWRVIGYHMRISSDWSSSNDIIVFFGVASFTDKLLRSARHFNQSRIFCTKRWEKIDWNRWSIATQFVALKMNIKNVCDVSGFVGKSNKSFDLIFVYIWHRDILLNFSFVFSLFRTVNDDNSTRRNHRMHRSKWRIVSIAEQQ